MLKPEVFEEYGKKRLREILEKGERPVIVAGMKLKYFWTHSYTHASADGNITLCGQKIIPTHVDSSLWNEVNKSNFKMRPCKKCKKRIMRTKTIKEKTIQTTFALLF